MDYIVQNVKKLKITYECINCQRTLIEPNIYTYLDTDNNIVIEYFCSNCFIHL